MNALRWKFSCAPMMDWTGCAKKAKHNQNLSMAGVGHAVPNAVLTIFKLPIGEQFRIAAFVWWLPRSAAYCANLSN
jgi:hypothetical protein